jgi:general secretion pathway protein K
MRATAATRGSALLVVLWVIAFLSFLIVTSMMVAMQDAESIASRQIVFRARQLAEAGLAIGAHPMIKDGDPLLRKRLSSNESYEVSITTEEGRLNINAMLTEERRFVLERLFELWGLRPPDAKAVVDCLMDWIDPDDFKRLNGAEKRDYEKEGFTDRPYNRPFQSLDEVALVRGMDMVAEANPKWRDSFTLWGNGALDINEAPAELIAVVADVPVSAAATLVSSRNGPDGAPHTVDDEPIQDMSQAMVLLGVPAQQSQAVTGMFTPHGTVMRVDSIGRVGSYARRISVVVQKAGLGAGGGASPIMEWRETTPE